MHEDSTQDFRLDIFKLLRDQLSVSIHPIGGDQPASHAATVSGESLTRILREKFSVDDRRLCELGIDIAAQGRAAITLHCTQKELRAAHLMPPS